MSRNFLTLAKYVGIAFFATSTITSCIREELPDINVDVTGISSVVGASGNGIVKTTIQENGVSLYADMANADPTNLDLEITVSKGATWSFVDVKMDSTFIDYQGQKLFVPGQCPIDTTVIGEIATPHDFTKTRYIKVVCAREGIHEDDHLTQQIINSQNSMFIGWEKDGQRTKEYVEGAHLYKIWSINLLPAGIPTTLPFDNWANIAGTEFQQPYELIADNNGKMITTNIWSSTNASIALMAKTMPLVMYGSRATTDVAPVRDGENKSALLLTSNDIRYTNTGNRPFLAGCCFIGEFDGSDTGALTCTHVGLPFNQMPEKLCFWYKYLPMTIEEPNANPFGYSFTVPGISDYVGKKDKGFIRAVLYRADGDHEWLNGESIRNLQNEDIIAYADFVPGENKDYDESVYTYQEVPFVTVHQVVEEDLAKWKYNLAIYFASSYDGFRFICGANMSNQIMKLQELNAKVNAGVISQMEMYGQMMQLLSSQMGTQLYIDEMEIKCK